MLFIAEVSGIKRFFVFRVSGNTLSRLRENRSDDFLHRFILFEDLINRGPLRLDWSGV